MRCRFSTKIWASSIAFILALWVVGPTHASVTRLYFIPTSTQIFPITWLWEPYIWCSHLEGTGGANLFVQPPDILIGHDYSSELGSGLFPCPWSDEHYYESVVQFDVSQVRALLDAGFVVQEAILSYAWVESGDNEGIFVTSQQSRNDPCRGRLRMIDDSWSETAYNVFLPKNGAFVTTLPPDPGDGPSDPPEYIVDLTWLFQEHLQNHNDWNFLYENGTWSNNVNLHFYRENGDDYCYSRYSQFFLVVTVEDLDRTWAG
jgi:hypothetical protein